MDLQQIQWKIHLRDGNAPHPHAWFKSFATWINNSPEILVDVADYSHVEDGPVIILVGHEAHYSIDHAGRRLGLLRDQRHWMSGNNTEKLLSTLRATLTGAARLEGDSAIQPTPGFLASDLKLVINSRAIAPNTDETLQAIKPELQSVLDGLYGAGEYSLSRDLDPRQRFTVQVTSKQAMTVSQALSRLK